MRRQILPAALFLPAALLLPACTASHQPHGPAPSHLVDRSLRDAAQAVGHDLSLLTGSEVLFDGSLTDGSGRILRPLTLHFEGPLGEALEKVCATIGYRLVRSGPEPDVPVIVHVSADARPALHVLRDIGAQTGPDVRVVVGELARVVELHHLHPTENARPRSRNAGHRGEAGGRR